MKKELKKRIDDVWLNTNFGQWCVAVAEERMQDAEIIRERIFNDGYFSMEWLENELADKIAELIHDETEVDEYLELLEKENYDLVDVLIREEFFYEISKRLENDMQV